MSAATDVRPSGRNRPMTREEKKVILASSAGTIFEWYDFYLYGALAAIIGAQFFSSYPEATRNVFALLAFAAGFLVRPFGALVFGSLGDLVGRKYTFLVTITIMGLSTFLVGLLPGYTSWGVAAPILLIALRMLQGLALGGEYGGAAVYVAEHAPQDRRGYFTSFIQTTATLGLLLSLIVILVVTAYVNNNWDPVPLLKDGIAVLKADGTPETLTPFQAWGWRIPFLMSSILLVISLYIRLQMNESPAFKKIKAEGTNSKTPLRETFLQWKNAKFALIALLGLTAGQAVVWYSGQFYALFFLQNIAKVDFFTVNVLVAWSLILGTGGFIVFGSWSDRIGRKPIILAGCALAAVSYFTVFGWLMQAANPALAAAQATTVTVTADPEDCSFQFNPTGTVKFTNSCDVAKALLSRSAVNSTTVDGAAGSVATVTVGETVIDSYDAGKNTAEVAALQTALETTKAATDQAATDAAQAALDTAKGAAGAFTKSVNDALAAAGYPVAGVENTTIVKISSTGIGSFFDIFSGQKLSIIAILTFLVLLVTMVYGPIAAALVELFPTRIRYSGLSLPYHIGNGWFGGLLPATVFAISAQTGNVYSGLWYPIIIASATVIIGAIFVPNGTHHKDIFKD